MLITLIKGTTVKRRMPVNVTEEDKPVFERVLNSEIKDILVSRIKNSSVIYNGSIFQYWRAVKGMLLANDEGDVVAYSLPAILKVFLSWPRQKLKNGITYLAIHNNYSHTYYHWLTEALPRLFLMRWQIANSTLLLPSNHNQVFHHEGLQVFGVKETQTLLENIRYVVPDLVTSSQIGRIANYNPVVIREMAEFIKSKTDCSLNFGDKIYISRSKSTKRKITNEAELEMILQRAEFKIIHAEDFSFVEQISIMHHCRYLVGVHGAGLANMIFMQENGRVFELRKDDRGTNYFFFSLSSATNHQYYYQFCDGVDKDASVQETDIRVDIELFAKNIDLMLSL